MGREVAFDYSKAAPFVRAEELENMKSAVMCAKDVLVGKTGAGNDFLGWIDLPVDYDKEEFARIKKAAEKIQNDSDVLLVAGTWCFLEERESPQRAEFLISEVWTAFTIRSMTIRRKRF